MLVKVVSESFEDLLPHVIYGNLAAISKDGTFRIMNHYRVGWLRRCAVVDIMKIYDSQLGFLFNAVN